MKYVVVVTITLFGPLLGAKGGIFNINNVENGPVNPSILHNGDFLHADEFGNLLTGPQTIVALGYFPVAFDVLGNLNNIPLLRANYTILNSSAVGVNSISLGGSFPGYLEVEGPLGPFMPNTDPLFGRPLYSFAGNASTLLAATSFSLNTAGSIQADLFPSIQASHSTNPVGRTILIGNVTQITGDFGAGFGVYNRLQLIPEPSVTLLSALGVFGLLRRRR